MSDDNSDISDKVNLVQGIEVDVVQGTDRDLVVGLHRALTLASVLPHEPEADRISDELLRKKMAGWEWKPLTRRTSQ